jgi:hypothetical protein
MHVRLVVSIRNLNVATFSAWSEAPEIIYPIDVTDELRRPNAFRQLGPGDLEGDDVVNLARGRGARLLMTRVGGDGISPFGQSPLSRRLGGNI